jgi:hypothetical protein
VETQWQPNYRQPATASGFPRFAWACPTGRRIQPRYFDRAEGREIRISTGTHDVGDAAERKHPCEAADPLTRDHRSDEFFTRGHDPVRELSPRQAMEPDQGEDCVRNPDALAEQVACQVGLAKFGLLEFGNEGRLLLGAETRAVVECGHGLDFPKVSF